MGQLLIFIVVALVVAAIVFGVTVMVSGGDTGLTPVEPDGRSLPLPGDRPLGEEDVFRTRFDVAFRGYRMAQVDQALQRAAYDIGYKGELIGVLEAEVTALREGRMADADVLRRAREASIAPPPATEDASGSLPEIPPPADPPVVLPAAAAAERVVSPPTVPGPAAASAPAVPGSAATPEKTERAEADGDEAEGDEDGRAEAERPAEDGAPAESR